MKDVDCACLSCRVAGVCLVLFVCFVYFVRAAFPLLWGGSPALWGGSPVGSSHVFRPGIRLRIYT